MAKRIYDNKDWENMDGYIDEICIPDKNMAINIASAILERFKNEGLFINYIAQTVFYDTQDKIWVVSFWENEKKDFIKGGDFCIALKAENSQVIKIWCGE